MEEFDRARRAERATKRRMMRTSRGQTQPEVAEAIGVTLRAFQKWQAGGGMKATNLRKLSEFWGVPISELRGDEDAPPSSGGLATSADVAHLRQEITNLRAEIIRLLEVRAPEAPQGKAGRATPSRRPKQS